MASSCQLDDRGNKLNLLNIQSLTTNSLANKKLIWNKKSCSNNTFFHEVNSSINYLKSNQKSSSYNSQRTFYSLKVSGNEVAKSVQNSKLKVNKESGKTTKNSNHISEKNKQIRNKKQSISNKNRHFKSKSFYLNDTKLLESQIGFTDDYYYETALENKNYKQDYENKKSSWTKKIIRKTYDINQSIQEIKKKCINLTDEDRQCKIINSLLFLYGKKLSLNSSKENKSVSIDNNLINSKMQKGNKNFLDLKRNSQLLKCSRLPKDKLDYKLSEMLLKNARYFRD